MGKNSDTASKEAFWLRHIEAWRGEGVSLAMYCDRENLSRSAFGYWRRKLSAPRTPLDGFIKLKLPANRAAGMIYLRLRTGIELGVVPGTDVRYVGELVNELDRG